MQPSRVSDEVRRLDSLLARAEEREGELERRTAAMTELESVVEALQAKLGVQAESQAVREKELSAREKDADRRARAEAKRYLLDARKEVESAIAAARASADDESARAARRALEEAAAALQQARGRRTGAGRRHRTVSARRPGQRVRLATGVTGDVLEVRADGRLVVAVGSMRMVADPDGVQVLGRREERRDRASQASADAPGHEAVVEVDLRGMTGDEAEGATLAAVDSAVLAEQPFLRIIHGMGTGVVRERVRRVLQRDRRVAKFDFAPAAAGRHRRDHRGVLPDEPHSRRDHRAGQGRHRHPGPRGRVGGPEAHRQRLARLLSVPRRHAPQLRRDPAEGPLLLLRLP